MKDRSSDKKANDKKAEQLGMPGGTASHRLLKDLLFDFVIKAGHKCFVCGEKLTRDTFSIEHKVPWLDSENPKDLFFDLENIAYSHLRCNITNKRPKKKTVFRTPEEHRVFKRSYYTTEDRQARYKRTGN
jgi:hypothetical protein